MDMGMILFKNTNESAIYEIKKKLREMGMKDILYLPLDKGFDYLMECIQ